MLMQHHPGVSRWRVAAGAQDPGQLRAARGAVELRRVPAPLRRGLRARGGGGCLLPPIDLRLLRRRRRPAATGSGERGGPGDVGGSAGGATRTAGRVCAARARCARHAGVLSPSESLHGSYSQGTNSQVPCGSPPFTCRIKCACACASGQARGRVPHAGRHTRTASAPSTVLGGRAGPQCACACVSGPHSISTKYRTCALSLSLG
jgi:hypothetical protein